MSNLSFPGLLPDGWRDLAFEPFRNGITAHWLERGGIGHPSVAILNYSAGARVPRHRHPGLETIIVLDGVQSDENGDYAAGTVVINRVGSEHSVWTQSGCVVLIQWDLPVIILGGET